MWRMDPVWILLSMSILGGCVLAHQGHGGGAGQTTHHGNGGGAGATGQTGSHHMMDSDSMRDPEYVYYLLHYM